MSLDSEYVNSYPADESVSSRWNMFYDGRWYDPYNTNRLKADAPIFGSAINPWFLELGMTSQSIYEGHDIPLPVGFASTKRSGSPGIFGDGYQDVLVQNFIFSLSLIQGNTSFKPPNFELRFSPVFQMNYVSGNETGVLNIDPSKGITRFDNHIGIQELFADIHIADISERYDFISTRTGIQTFNADFRGFLFVSQEPAFRLFGNADNNRWQYSLFYSRRLEKDSNSGLNNFLDDRNEDIILANLYYQDFIFLGYTIQGLIAHRRDRAGEDANHYNRNGFLVRPASIGDERPKNIDSTYLGINSDGHIDRWNISQSAYFVFGNESHNSIAGREVSIRAWQLALELSYDFDWLRVRGSGLWISGDNDPFDDRAGGFDAIVDNPTFAGGENSYWQRQGLPFVAGGIVNLMNRNSFIPSLRPGKEEGQSNFVHPGLQLLNLGLDVEVTPKLRSVNNFNYIRFDDASVLKALRQDSKIEKSIGYDLSTGLLYRPFLNNNIQMKAGGALFVPGSGFARLFGDDLKYQFFSELVLLY